MWHHNDKLIGVTTVHVDDFVCVGTYLFYLNISKLRETFSVGKKENCNCNLLKKVDINPVHKLNPVHSLSDSKRETLRAKIDQLLWISMTRY